MSLQSHGFKSSIRRLRHETGIVIPVYLSNGDQALGAALLRDNVSACCTQVADPAAVCLSVDGAQYGQDVAVSLSTDLGVLVVVSPQNQGKLGAATLGVRRLLNQPHLAYVAVVDQDGDHFANELLNFIRIAEHITCETGQQRVLVLGQRSSRHRPMGFIRGELEELADRVLLDALAYDAALSDTPLRLEYAASLAEYPDFHSGYKLFSRESAQAVFSSVPNKAGVSDDCYFRHAVEAVMTVEALSRGAYLGVVNRSTINEQPFTTFGAYNVIQLMADTIIWPCKRLNVPLSFVRQWLDNHIPRLLLNTVSPQGKEMLSQLRECVLRAYGDRSVPESHSPLQPLFV